MTAFFKKLRGIRSQAPRRTQSSKKYSIVTGDPTREAAAEMKLFELLQQPDWQIRINSLAEPEYTQVIQAKSPVFLKHGRVLSERQSKASWLDMKGSAISQRSLYRH